MVRAIGAVFLAAAVTASAPALAETIRVASTTSTEASGFFDYLLPRFTAATGIRVRVIAVGTGQAIRLARRGDADVLLVHHRPSEEAFVRAGYGLRRYSLMYNDFVIVGPASDPAGVRGATDAVAAFRKIHGARAVFLSRGDDSGTHRRERSLWRASGIAASERAGWYREIGAGMGRTLNTAAAMPAYTLVDRGTWLSFGNRGPLRLLVEGDRRLRNPYGVIAVSPKKHPHVRAKAARRFVAWLVSTAGQRAIGNFRIGDEVLFHPVSPKSGG
ncbi:MAG: substrate-binding domain-containing protein [Rhodospirillaceae bacterium]|nr:substrate-binding domain-containing protein [Rhodospirillaceae bacterium]